jgi:hypothetical protein
MLALVCWLALCLQVEKGLWSAPAIRSKAPKDVTPKALTGGDTRCVQTKDPYPEPIGEHTALHIVAQPQRLGTGFMVFRVKT